MKKIIQPYLAAFLIMAQFILPSASLFAQTLSPKATPTTGGYSIAGGISLSFTAGETFNSTLQSGTLILTQGEQQPLSIFKAVANPSSQAICSGSAITTIALTGNTNGTIYRWTRDNVNTITGIAASGTGDISGVLTNSTNTPATATFTIIPTANNNTGAAITATVLVNPVPPKPTTACYEKATFNTTTCAWEVTGIIPPKPLTACYQSASFNNQTCSWDVTGAQPGKPTLACYQSATFNNQTCQWDISGEKPLEPTKVNCWDNYQFNTTSCTWVSTGVQPVKPSTACFETATFNSTTCQWEAAASLTYYKDADSDGFGNPAITMQDCTKPSGYVSNNLDCDDTKAAINPNTMWYKDADNDGYYTGIGVKSCTSPGTGYRYTGITAGGDCNDANANVNPGKTEICGNNIDDNCDGQIDEGCNNKLLVSISDATVYESAGTVTLTVSLSRKSTQAVTVTYATAEGTARSKANPNNPADFTTQSGTLTIPANTQSGTVTIPIISDNVKEPTEQFTVQLSKPVNAAIDKGVGTITILDGNPPITGATITMMDKAPLQSELFAQKLMVRALPNPSTSYFTLVIQSASKEAVRLQLTDAVGRMMEGKNGIAPNTNLRMGQTLRPGVYFVRVMQGSKAVTLKLVKQ